LQKCWKHSRKPILIAFAAVPYHSKLCQERHKSPVPFNVEFSWGNRYRPAAASSGECGDAPMFSYFNFLINYLPTPAGVLEHCRDGQTTYLFFFFGAVPSYHIYNATKDVLYRNFSHAANNVN
jgi:hypothetical protein